MQPTLVNMKMLEFSHDEEWLNFHEIFLKLVNNSPSLNKGNRVCNGFRISDLY